MTTAVSIALPKRGDPVTAGQLAAFERAIAADVLKIDDLAWLEETRAQARALERYLRDKELQQPMLGVQRRIEARIGQLLGEAPGQGTRTDLTSHHDAKSNGLDEHHQTLDDFRLLAHGLNGHCALDDSEWRKSRRALISLVRHRLGLVPPLPVLPDGIFRCIVADPPWKLDTGPDAWNTVGDSGHDALAYEQMTVDAIAAMPVAAHAADDAHLYLWTVNRYVEHAYSVARAWGFKPSVLLVWAKTPHGVGLGDKFRLTTEFILYARRGRLEENRICETTWFNWPRSIHSRKPEEFFDLAEAMTPAPHGERDRLELFARKQRPGWTTWGDEIP